MIPRNSRLLMFCVAVLAFVSLQASAIAQPANILAEGKDDYEFSCQASHGKDGTGGGEVYRGSVLITSLSMTSDMEAPVTYSGTAIGTGPLYKSTVASS